MIFIYLFIIAVCILGIYKLTNKTIDWIEKSDHCQYGD